MHYAADCGRREVSVIYPFLVASMAMGHAAAAKASKVYVFSTTPHTTFQLRRNNLASMTVTSTAAGSLQLETAAFAGDRFSLTPVAGQPPAPPLGVSAGSESPSCITVRWSPSGDPSVAGYVVSFGTGSGDGAPELRIADDIDAHAGEYVDVDVRPGRSYAYTLAAVHDDGTETRSVVAAVNTAPLALTLEQNRPNPFNPSTQIPFTLERNSRVVVRVFDVAGSHVATVFDGRLAEGRQTVDWDGRDVRGHRVASGVYLYTLSTESRTLSKKMVMVK